MIQNDEKLVINSLQRQLETKLKKQHGNKWQEYLINFLDKKPLYGPDGLRRLACENDLSLFGKLYLPDYFYAEESKMHEELNEIWLENVKRKTAGTKTAEIAPRGHAKSTSVTFKDTLHAVAYQYKKYIILISDSSDQADNFLSDIKDALENNERIKEDFGELEGDPWKSNVIVTNTGIKVEALGSGKKIRGRKHHQYRPDLIILDDIENDENVRTPEQRRKLENWYYKAVSKSGLEYTDYFVIGTILHYDSLLEKIMRNPAYHSKKYQAVISFSKAVGLWDQWERIFSDLSNKNRKEDALQFFKYNEQKMLEGTKVLWPETKSYYSLMVDKLSEGVASFNSEFQNEPIDPDDCYFNEEKMGFFNEHELFTAMKNNPEDYLLYGFVDPSLGKSNKSDYSAIITIAKEQESGYMYVITGDIERRLPDKIKTDIFETAKWLKRDFGIEYQNFGCETNQFQWLFKENLAKESAKEGLYLPLSEINQTKDKMGRIQSLQPYIENHYVKFNRNHKKLLEQLKYFPKADHDDGPDALEGCITIAKTADPSIYLI